MADTIDIPKIGTVKKTQAVAVAGVAGGILVYAWWRSRSAAVDSEPAPEPEDPFLGVTDTGPGGMVSGYPTNPGSDTATTAPRTNIEWSQLAAEKLAGSYEPQLIDAALGRFLGRQPLTTLDTEIVRAAIARAGNPPEGGPYAVISGGDTAIKVAPGGVTVRAGGPTYATISWSEVPGAKTYYVYMDRTARPTVANGTSLQWSGLPTGAVIRFQVSAVSASGLEGPRSGWVPVDLPTPKLTAPAGLSASKIERTQVTLTYRAVPGAAGYQGFQSGAYVGTASAAGTTMVFGGLTPGKRYALSVAARTGIGTGYGPKSTVHVTTKK